MITRRVDASEYPTGRAKGDDVSTVDAEWETRVGSLQSGRWRDDVPTAVVVFGVGGHDDDEEEEEEEDAAAFVRARVAVCLFPSVSRHARAHV